MWRRGRVGPAGRQGLGWTRLLSALGAGLAAGALYVRTLAPTVTLVDSGELILCTTQLDVAHPPGFPLYVLLGWLWSHLPWGSLAWRLNLFSAATSALAVALVVVLVDELAGVEDKAPGGRGGRGPGDRWGLLGAVGAALAFATSRTHWSWATSAEVYGLNTALMVAILGLAAAWRRRGRAWQLYATGLLFGLGLGVHLVSVALLLPALVYWLLWAGRARPTGRQLLAAGFLALAGASVYLYQPLRAAGQPLLNWGNPADLQRLLWQVSGRQYHSTLFATPPGRMVALMGQFLRSWATEFTPAGLALALVGVWELRQRDSRWLVAGGSIVLLNLAYTLNYDIAEDLEAYYLPSYVVTATWLGAGLTGLQRRLRVRGWARGAPLVALATIVPALALVAHYRQNDRHACWLARDYALNTLASVEPGGLLLTRDWQFYSPSLYLQHVEGVRPDAAVIDVELLRRTWYVDYVRRQYPDLVARVAGHLDLYLEDLWRFEYGRPYDAGRIQARYIGLINALIDAAQAGRGSACVGLHMESGVGAGERWVPRGLVFELYDQEPAVVPPQPALELRGLADGSTPLDRVARQKVRPTYALMLTSRGLYLAGRGDHAQAIACYQQALSLEPGAVAALRGAGRSLAALGRWGEAVAAYEAALRLAPTDPGLAQEAETVRARLQP